MADQDEDDSFIKEFMRRAREREEKIKAKAVEIETTMKQQEVSYPPLSPLPEENSGIESPEVDQNESSISDDEDDDEREENVSPDSRLNYSSDLSLDCETNEVYRAEPVVCHSSPEHQIVVPQTRQLSPRKQAASQGSKHSVEATAPLQERQPEQKATSSQSLPEQGQSQNDVTSRDLQRKIERAEQNKQQLRKAVEISKHGSQEHIEAARLLQIAELEHQIFTHHLALFTQGDRKRKSESLGSIKIQNVKLKISAKLRNDLAEEGVLHNFFIVISCGTEIKATEIVDTNKIKQQDLKAYIQFKDCITFANLPPDFVVKLEVFELVIRQQLPKLLSRLTPSKKSKVTPDSHFKRIGSMRLTLADRDSCYKNLVQWSEYEKSKYIEKECKFNMELKPEQLPCISGMMHVRCYDNEGKLDWSREYVDLSEDGLLRLWKTEQDCRDGKKPNLVLELGDMCCECVQKLGPTDDLYRQNSFVIHTLEQVSGDDKNTPLQFILEDDPKSKIVKHQFAAANKEDRDLWSSILDRSMRCYREWNGITKVYSLDEVRAIFCSSN